MTYRTSEPDRSGNPSGYRIFIFVVVSILVSAAACTHPVRRLVFQPHQIAQVPAFPENAALLERVWIQSDQGPVEGWLMKGRAATPQQPGPAVILAHGNRELIDFYLERARVYQDMGLSVLLGEYRGYGRSAGNPSRERIREDYFEFYDYLASQPWVDPVRIVFHGRSLGGAVLADLLNYRRAAAVILESTFTSIKAMAYGAPDFLLCDNYDTVSAMAGFHGPVLIIHGNQDQVVPVQHARVLKEMIPQATLVLDDFGHNDNPPDWMTYWKSIWQFIDQAGVLPADGRVD